MTDRMATAEELTAEFSRAQDREFTAHKAYERAIEYRVRMGINLELALEREENA